MGKDPGIRHRMMVFGLAVIGWMVISGLSFGQDGPSLILNGDFEIPLSPDADWGALQADPSIHGQALVEPSPEGKGQCLKLDINGKGAWSLSGALTEGLNAGQSYRLSCRAASDRLSGEAKLCIYETDATGTEQILAMIFLEPESRWKTYFATAKPKGQGACALRWEGSGACLFRVDDVSLVALGAKPERVFGKPRSWDYASLTRRVGKLFQIEDILVKDDAWDMEDKAQPGQWILTSQDTYSPVWMKEAVLRSPKGTRESPEVAARIPNLVPGDYHVFVSDPGSVLLASIASGPWQRVEGGARETDLGSFKVERELSIRFKPAPLEDRRGTPCYVDFVRLLPSLDPIEPLTPVPQPLVSGVASREIACVLDLPKEDLSLPLPCTVGVPLAPGTLSGTESMLCNSGSEKFVSGWEPLSRWQDQSVRWAAVRVLVPGSRSDSRSLTLSFSKTQSPASSFAVQETSEAFLLKGRTAEISLQRNTGDILQLKLDLDWDGVLEEEETLLREPAYLRIQCENPGKPMANVLMSSVSDFKVEQNTAVFLRAKVSGSASSLVSNDQMKFAFWITLYEGLPAIQYQWFVFSDQPKPPQCQSISWVFPLFSKDPLRYSFPTTGSQFMQGQVLPGEQVILCQRDRSTCEGWSESETSVSSFMKESRSPGWAFWGSDSRCLGLQFDHFADYHPCAFSGDEREARIYFMTPGGMGISPIKWTTGMGRSFSGFLLGLQRDHVKKADQWLRAATLATPLIVSPDDIRKALPRDEFLPQDEGTYSMYEKLVKYSADHCLKGLEERGDSGTLDYGDHSVAKSEDQAYWSNVRQGLPHVLFTEFLRSGDRRLSEAGRAAARHQRDVDTDHANGGIHGPGYGHTLAQARADQIWASGLLDIWHMTGDVSFLEGAVEAADWILKTLEEDPVTVLATSKSVAACLSSLTALYEETWAPHYLEAASKLVSYTMRWQDQTTGLWASPLESDLKAYGTEPEDMAALISSLAELGRVATSPLLAETLHRAVAGLRQEAQSTSPLSQPLSMPFHKMALARALGNVADLEKDAALMQEAMVLFNEGIQDGMFLGRDFDIFALSGWDTPTFLSRASRLNIFPSNDTSLFMHPIFFAAQFSPPNLQFHPFFLTSPPQEWRFLIEEKEDQAFSVTVYKGHIAESVPTDLYLENTSRYVCSQALLKDNKDEKVVLSTEKDNASGVYTLRIVPQAAPGLTPSAQWALAVSPPLPLVLELPNTMGIMSVDPIQLFFIVPDGVSTLSCRLALRRPGGMRARLMGPDDSVLNQIEVLQRHGGAEKPDWQLLSADIPPELAGQVCSLVVQGTMDILLQPVGLAKYGAATREALFQVKIKSPWD